MENSNWSRWDSPGDRIEESKQNLNKSCENNNKMGQKEKLQITFPVQRRPLPGLGCVKISESQYFFFYFHTAQRCDNWKIKRTCHSCLQLWWCCMQRRVYFPLCVALLSLSQSVGRADRQTGLLKVTAVWSGQSCTQSGPGTKWLGTCRTHTPCLALALAHTVAGSLTS